MKVLPWRVFLPIAALVLLLGGCAVSTMSLTQDELRSIRIERVNVQYAPGATISWEKVETPYVERMKAAKVHGKPKPWKQVMKEDEDAAKFEYQDIINSPEGKQYMQNALAAELKKRVGATIVPKFQGTRRVVLEITVTIMSIPGPLQRIVIGGGPTLIAVTTLKDAQTGQELAKLNAGGSGMAGNGALGVLVDQAFDDLDERVFAAYLSNLVDWLHAPNRQ
jgi:hypothetical protein